MAAALSIKGLKKVYEGGFEALKGIDLDVEEGDFFALLGPNGAGKSTTIGIIFSLVNKTIILTTHYLEEAEQLCRNIAIIDRGEIVEDTSMRALLKQLHREVFILDSSEDLPEEISLPGFDVERLDNHCMEIAIDKGQHINDVFELLSAAGVKISSMRNRANRLEELFVGLLAGKDGPKESSETEVSP